MIRRYIALASLAFIYVFYTIPITAAKSLVSPQNLEQTLPELHNWMNSTEYINAEIMSGLVSALLCKALATQCFLNLHCVLTILVYFCSLLHFLSDTAFFALCPVIFKGIANSGSQATSVQEAEKYALKYYWYFMLVTAFVFTGLADAALSIWGNRFVLFVREMRLKDCTADISLPFMFILATWSKAFETS